MAEEEAGRAGRAAAVGGIANSDSATPGGAGAEAEASMPLVTCPGQPEHEAILLLGAALWHQTIGEEALQGLSQGLRGHLE